MGRKGKDPQTAKCTGNPGELLALVPLHTGKIHRRIPDKEQKAGCTGELVRKDEGKEDHVDTRAVGFCNVCFRSWQADSVDSGCSSCAQTSPPHPEPCCVGIDPLHGHTFAGQADPYSPEKLQPPPLKVGGKGQGTAGAPRCSAAQPQAQPWKEGMCACTPT